MDTLGEDKEKLTKQITLKYWYSLYVLYEVDLHITSHTKNYVLGFKTKTNHLIEKIWLLSVPLHDKKNTMDKTVT